MRGERILTDLEQQKFQRERDYNERIIAIIERLQGLSVEEASQILRNAGTFIEKSTFVDVNGSGFAQMYAAFNDHFGGELKPPARQ